MGSVETGNCNSELSQIQLKVEEYIRNKCRIHQVIHMLACWRVPACGAKWTSSGL